MLLLLLLGGNETSTALLTNLTWRLLQVPDALGRGARRPRAGRVAVEESLRYDPPVLGLFRTPTHDVTLHGVTIPEKTKVMVCFASANHDAAVFDDAETLPPRPHARRQPGITSASASARTSARAPRSRAWKLASRCAA